MLVLCWQNQLRTSSLWHDGHMCVSVCVWQWAGRPRHPPPSLQPLLRPVPPSVWWNKVALVPLRLTPSIHLLCFMFSFSWFIFSMKLGAWHGYSGLVFSTADVACWLWEWPLDLFFFSPSVLNYLSFSSVSLSLLQFS